MTYHEPEVLVLGRAVHAIQGSWTKPGMELDGDGSGELNAVAPASDLDD